MAIHETKKQSDLEKRLKLLRQQVYGKENVSSIKYQVSNGKKVPIAEAVPVSKAITHNTDIPYLYHDLTKIGILCSLALGVQFVLFILMRNQILNFKF